MRGLCTLLLPFLILPSLALGSPQESDARDLFRQGIEAFEEDRYSQALEYFEQAASLGLSTPSLTYNRAVAHYRAGELDAARQLFEAMVVRGESTQLARYNLGLVALEADRPEAARDHFARVAREAQQAELRHLADQQLERLGAAPEPRPSWRGLVSVSAGYEDNLNLASERTREVDDGFMEAIVYGSGYLLGDQPLGLRLEGVVSNRSYLSETDSRQRVARPALVADVSWNDWQHSLIGDLEWAWLGGERVERRDRVQLRSRRALGSGRIHGAAGIARVRAGSGFAELDGRESFLELGYRHFWGQSVSTTASYRVLHNDRDDLVLEDGRFTSFSPVRHRLDLRAGGLDWQQWSFSPRLQFRFSRYRDADRDEEDASLKRRKEHRVRVGGFIERPLNEAWVVFVAPEWEINRANRDEREYTRLAVEAGVEWRW